MRYTTPYSTKAVRDRTLGEPYMKAFLETQWSPEARKAYEEKKAEEARKSQQQESKDSRKKYDAQERARWREAQKLAARASKPSNGMRDDPAYKVARYDAAGNRRSNVDMLVLMAVKIIRTDKNAFEDQFGVYRFPTSPVYAPRDWKLQAMLDTASLASEMSIREVSDIELKSTELNEKLSKVSTDIRKKKAFLGRIGSLYTAIEQWEATKEVIEALDKTPKDQKEQFKQEHSKEIENYNRAVGVFYKYSGRYATTPIMVYDEQAGKKVVSMENIAATLDSVVRTKEEIDKLQTERKQISADISKVRRISVGLALAQNDLFVHGPKYTPEKLQEIRNRAAAKEAQAISECEKVMEVEKEDFENYVDELLDGKIEEKTGFEVSKEGGKTR